MATAFHLPKIGRALLIWLIASHAALAIAETETEVDWTVRSWTIHGTLHLPATPVRAGVILLAGSGPTDRNWESKAIPGQNGSARLLAKSLAQAGVASMRYDKMGSGDTGVPDAFSDEGFKYTPEDYLNELNGALSALENALTPGTPIFLAGHSEGGLWALEAYRRQPKRFAGIVLMATAGRSQCTLVQEQIHKAMQEYQTDKSLIASEMLLLKKALTRVASGEKIPDNAQPNLPLLQGLIDGYTAPKTAALGRWLCGTDPITILPPKETGLLILQGGNDLQVHPEHDGKRLQKAAPNATYVLAPKADHVLKTLDLKGAPLHRTHAYLYNQPDRVLDPILTEALLRWLREQLGEN